MPKINPFDVQGHRGCRGLLPENTIPAFIQATALGVTTLEMDVVITGDHHVLVSHEPWFSHEISTGPNGVFISEEIEKEHNIHMMSMNEIATYDVGLKPHPRFPKQLKMAVSKPLFLDAIYAVEEYVRNSKLKKPYYNVEIKFDPLEQGKFYSNAKASAERVVEAIWKTGIQDRFIVQSFSVEILQLVMEIDPKMTLALLVENKDTPTSNLHSLGFIPAIYSPHYKLVDAQLAALCHAKKMRLIPWTVNSASAMKQMLNLGVQGIITDYPDVLLALLKKEKIKVK